MGRTEELRRRDKATIWHPFTQMADWEKDDPLIIERGEGNYLYDTEGNRYFDGVSSLWVNLFGHRRKEVDDAVRAQLSRLAHSTFLGLSHPPAIELAEKLLTVAPPGLARVFYSDNGSTAMEIAIKMAFQYWRQKGGGEEKTAFLALSEAYHGDTIGSVSAGGIDLFHKIFRPLLFSTRRAPAPHCYRCPFDLSLPSCSLHCAELVEDMVRTSAGSLAAVVVEPLVQGAAGMLMMPDGYLSRLRAVTRECDVLLICDEVATGFGRTGTMFACEGEGIAPDIMAVAKGLTGGYLPLAATLTTEGVYRGFLGRYEEYKTFFHGHSYTANPLGCAAALAILSIFEKEDVLGRVSRLSAVMSKTLEPLARHPNVGDIRQKGLMAGIEIVASNRTKERFPAERKIGQRVARKARERGILLRPLGDVIVLMPPLSSTEREIEDLVTVAGWAIREILSTEGIPRDPSLMADALPPGNLRLLVTGTDTGVGKTYVGCLLGRRLATAGMTVFPLKPVESGCAAGPCGDLFPADAAALRDAMAPRLPLESVCRYPLSAPLSPHLAARQEGVSIDIGRIRTEIEKAAGRSDVVLVEGAGGISVEIVEGYSFADLARDCSLPVLVVAGNRLGVLNNVRLTIRYLESEGISLFGVVLNDLPGEATPARETNEDEMRRLAGDRYLGRVPCGADALPGKLFSRFREIALSLFPSISI